MLNGVAPPLPISDASGACVRDGDEGSQSRKLVISTCEIDVCIKALPGRYRVRPSCKEIVPLLSPVIAQVYLHSPSGRVERQRGEGDRRSSPRLGSTLLGKEGEGKRNDLQAGG